MVSSIIFKVNCKRLDFYYSIRNQELLCHHLDMIQLKFRTNSIRHLLLIWKTTTQNRWESMINKIILSQWDSNCRPPPTEASELPHISTSLSISSYIGSGSHSFFEMAAMPSSCNDILVILGNLTRSFCCVFRPANGCSASRSLVKINFWC